MLVLEVRFVFTYKNVVNTIFIQELVNNFEIQKHVIFYLDFLSFTRHGEMFSQNRLSQEVQGEVFKDGWVEFEVAGITVPVIS